MLIVMAGLPGVGKSSVGEALARKLAAPVVAVDPIEAAMWRGKSPRVPRRGFLILEGLDRQDHGGSQAATVSSRSTLG